jgi:hypothetical protein
LADVRGLLADHPSAEVRRLVRRNNDADDKDADGPNAIGVPEAD